SQSGAGSQAAAIGGTQGGDSQTSGGSYSAGYATDSAGSQIPTGPASPPDLTPDTWAELIPHLDLGGAARMLASNCLLIGRQGAVLRFALDARNKHMRT